MEFEAEGEKAIHRNTFIFATLVLSTYINILGKVNESLIQE